MNKDRKLASVQRISEIAPIVGADRIESVKVLGWECMASKGEFSKNELCVYFEIDSFLPVRPEFEVLRSNSYKCTNLMGEGFRVKTQTFRGKLSQGFVSKISILPDGNYTEGEDVSSLLGVREWEREEELDTFGKIIADMPAFLKRTTEYRIQSFPDVLAELQGKPYYITNKIDGVSTTVFNHGGIGVCGHEAQYELGTYAYLDEIQPALEAVKQKKNIAIQGEIAGPGICKNRAGYKEVGFNVFNIIDTITRELMPYDEMVKFCEDYGLRLVELDERGEAFSYTAEELIEKAEGVYKETGKRREGIVVRPLISVRSEVLMDRISIKVINNKYLMKNQD